MISVFVLDVSPPRAGIADLHAVLLQHPRIFDAYSEIPYSYWVKCEADMTAEDFADLVAAVIPGVVFFVAGLNPAKIAGFIRDRAKDWLETPAPPRRYDGHQPDAEAVSRLPSIELLEYNSQLAKMAALIDAPVKGEG